MYTMFIGWEEAAESQTKQGVDFKRKCSIMKSSVGNNPNRKSTKESEYIMAKKSNKVVAPIVAATVQYPDFSLNYLQPKKEAAAEVITTVAASNKATMARSIFGECYAMETVPQRKDIINRLVTEAGLTKAGAATYLQNYKSKNGLTNSKKSTATA